MESHNVSLRIADGMYAYISTDGRRLETWDGYHLLSIVSEEKPHNIGRTITYWYGYDCYGQRYYGKGSGRCMSTKVHKAKHS